MSKRGPFAVWLSFEFVGSGEASPLLVPVTEGSLTVGRGGSCSVVLRDDRVSGLHLTILRAGDRVEFRDEGSTSGTLLDGAPSRGGELRVGAVLGVGDVRIRLVGELPGTVRGKGQHRSGARPAVDWTLFTRFWRLLREPGEPRVLLERLLDGVIETFGVQRGFVLLTTTRGGGTVPVVARGLEDTAEAAAVSRTLTDRAMSTGATVVIESTLDDASCAAVASVQAGATRSVVVVPLGGAGRTFGAVYLDAEGRGVFSAGQLPLLEAVAAFAGELLAAAEVRSSLVAARDRLHRFQAMVGSEPAMVFGPSEASVRLQRLIETAAGQDVTVLLTGETGTGKEVAARLLHDRSPRAGGPFVPVNCAALPRDIIEAELFGAEKGAFTGALDRRLGRFELAAGGTLFLDEVGELPVDMQVKLLRVLQERRLTRLGGAGEVPVDFRLVCATNVDPERAVRDGRLREDFYFRINVFRVRLEPLRERVDDIMPLVRHFIGVFGAKFGKKVEGVAADAEGLLKRYPWPGNVRELRNAVEIACLVETGGLLRAASFPMAPSSLGPGASAAVGSGVEDFWGRLPRDFVAASEAFEQEYLERMLEHYEGNVTLMARETGMTRNAIYRRFAKYGLGRGK